MPRRRLKSATVLLGLGCVAWAGCRPSSGIDATAEWARSDASPESLDITLTDDGFSPGGCDVDLGSIPAAARVPTVKINLRNRQLRAVRVFGNSSTCNEWGCSRTNLTEGWIEPGQALRFMLEPSFKSGNILKAEAAIFAGSDRLFEWTITMHGERIAAAPSPLGVTR